MSTPYQQLELAKVELAHAELTRDRLKEELGNATRLVNYWTAIHNAQQSALAEFEQGMRPPSEKKEG